MFLLVLSSFLYGLSYPLADIMIGDVDTLEFAFHFLLALTVIQLPMVLLKWREVVKMSFAKEFKLLILSGLIGTFLYWCEFSSLDVGLPISHLTFLSLTVPAWALLYEWARGRGKSGDINKWVIALIGSVILISPNDRGQFSMNYLLPIVTSLLMAFWLIYSKKCSEAGVSPIVCSFFNDFFSLIGISIFILINGRPDNFSIPDKQGSLALYAIAIGVLPNLLLLYGLKFTKVTSAATIIMLEPIFIGMATIIATNEEVTRTLIVGVLFITVSNLPDNALAGVKKLTALYGLNNFK